MDIAVQYALHIITHAPDPLPDHLTISLDADRDDTYSTLNTSGERLKYGDTPRSKLRQCKPPAPFHASYTLSRIVGAAPAIGAWGGGRPPCPYHRCRRAPLAHSHTHSHMLVGTCQTAQSVFDCRVVRTVSISSPQLRLTSVSSR